MSALALDLRRGPAPVLALVVLGLGAAMVLPDECASAAVQLRRAMWLVFPCAFAAGVWHGGAARRRHVDETLGALPAPPWRRAAVEGGSLAVAAVAALVVLLALTAFSGGCGTGSLGAIVAGMLALPAAAFAGLALGRLAPAPMAAPLALFVALAVPSVFGGWAPGDGAARLVLPLVREDVTAADLTARISAGQALWFTGLAASGWLVREPSARGVAGPGRGRPGRAAGARGVRPPVLYARARHAGPVTTSFAGAALGR